MSVGTVVFQALFKAPWESRNGISNESELAHQRHVCRFASISFSVVLHNS